MPKMIKAIKEFKFRCAIGLHLWSKWVTDDSGLVVTQQRQCEICGRLQMRQVVR